MLELESALLVSDVHLSETQSETAELFFNFLEQHAPKYQNLLILGDLFDAWPGDDLLLQPPVFVSRLIDLLRSLERSGMALYFMPGNRDFLLGQGFASASGLKLGLLPDPCVVHIAGTKTLLAHGDAYCTDDIEYQTMRRQVRTAAWQEAVLAKPINERITLAQNLRAESETAKRGKSMEIMDVNAKAIAKAFSDHQVGLMIHGHTHRPGMSTVESNKRHVLPDWHAPSGLHEPRRGGGIGITAGRGLVALAL